MNNPRPVIYFAYQGETKSLGQWAKLYKLDRSTIYTRFKQGWPVEKILLTRPLTREESGLVPRERTRLYK
jgi:hypothetical protein